MAARLTSGRFVGRAAELAVLASAWSEAREGTPLLVLVAGESGGGKSRLIAEFAGRLGPEATALHGESVQGAQAELPYAALLGALRQLHRDRHPILEAISPGSRAQLATLLPALGPAPAVERELVSAGQLRLFEALLELFERLSDERALLLVLEDIHWADASTRTFLEFLARSLRDERILVVLSFRSDELHRRHPLRPLLATLERLGQTRRLDLPALDLGETGAVIAELTGEAPDAEVVARVHARSEGNPLYTEELLAAGLDGRGAPPQSLREAFMLRVERLGEDAQRTIRVAAVAGTLDEAMAQAATALDLDRVTAALRECVAAQLLVLAGSGRIGFRHALLREVIIDDLLPGERAELHCRLAESLEARAGSGDLEQVAEVATHWAGAGRQDRALRASAAAAGAAASVHAHGEAADLAARALELWPRVADAEAVSGTTRVDLLVLAAEGLAMVRARDRGEPLLREALRELGEDGDPLRRADLLGRLARAQWRTSGSVDAITTGRQALALLDECSGEEAASVRAGMLVFLARTQVLRGRLRDGLRDAQAALAEAQRVGSARGEAHVLNTLGMAQLALGDVEAGSASLRGAIAIAREAGDLDEALTGYVNLADLLNLRGRTREALDVAREGERLAPRHLGAARDWSSLILSELEFELGMWESARAHLELPLTKFGGRHLVFGLLRHAELALADGQQGVAEERLREAAGLVAGSLEPQWIGLLGALQAELHLRRHEPEAARGAVAAALDRLEVCTDDVMRIARLSAVGLRVESVLAQRGRDLRDPATVRRALREARLHMQRLSAAAAEGGPVESAWRAVGRAELSRARGRSDVRLWRRAAEEWEALERPYPALLCRLAAAEALAQDGERSAARAEVLPVVDTVRRLGSPRLARELERLGERARLDLGGDPGDGAGTGADGGGGAGAGAGANAGGVDDPYGLTPRERQVLALIVEGATNRQIGQALFMAEKTASVHVSRILAKLGVGTRTQAAALAHRMDLV